MHIGEKIRYYREKEKMTQQEMADNLFMSDRTIGHYETGKRTPTLDILKNIAKVLKVELDDFFQEEAKRLMQLQYTYKEFIQILKTQSHCDAYGNITPVHFTSFLGSDRYYLKLKRDYNGSPMTYLIWLLDGFYLVPLRTERFDGENETYIDDGEIKKVSKSDVGYIQKASGRTYIKSNDERSFAESIYSSEIEKMDFKISHNLQDDLYAFIFYSTEGLYAFDYEEEKFYVKNKKGVIKIPYPEAVFDEFGFLEMESYRLKKPVILKNEEILIVKQYVFEKEKEARLLLNEYENTETMDIRKTLGERYRKKIAFVDKMKKILEVRELQDFCFLPTEEEVQIEREEEKEREKKQRNKINVSTIKANLNNKVIYVHEGGMFFNAIHSEMVERIGYQLIKTMEDRHLFLENVKEIMRTPYEPNIIMIKIDGDSVGMIDLIKKIRKMSKVVKIVPMVSLVSKETLIEYIKAGADHFIKTPTSEDMKEVCFSMLFTVKWWKE